MTRNEKICLSLLCVCVAVMLTTWLVTFIQTGSAETKLWSPIAGFFKGYIYAGVLSIIPASYSAKQLDKNRDNSVLVKMTFIISTIWFCSVVLVYLS